MTHIAGTQDFLYMAILAHGEFYSPVTFLSFCIHLFILNRYI